MNLYIGVFGYCPVGNIDSIYQLILFNFKFHGVSSYNYIYLVVLVVGPVYMWKSQVKLYIKPLLIQKILWINQV